MWVEDFATISAFSGVHQFCRVGEHAFIGGYSVVTKDAMPFAKTVGNRARIYGLNTIGLMRRGFTEEALSKLKRAYRYLLRLEAHDEPRAARRSRKTTRSPAPKSITSSSSSAARSAA